MNWGGVEGENALGFSGIAEVARRTNSTFAVSGAVGFGLEHDQLAAKSADN